MAQGETSGVASGSDILMFVVEAIIPDTLLDADALLAAVNEGLDRAAEWVKSDFEQTTQTWNTKVDFAITAPGIGVREIGTDNVIFVYVNNGTPAHTITARNGKFLRFTKPFAPKTQKNVISAYGGNKGSDVVYAKTVKNPGILGREFDSTIAREFTESDRLASLIQDSIDKTLG